MKIFMSYGHDEYHKIAEKIRDDLVERGLEVWFDKKSLNVSTLWDSEIEKGIQDSNCVLMVMTNHALRRPDGVCLDELSYARMLGKPIAPVMIQFTKPPLLISRLQWLDMQDVVDPVTKEIRHEKYQLKLEKLLNVLTSQENLPFEGFHHELKRILKPFDHELDMVDKLHNFVGREWLYQEYDRWSAGDSESRVFFIIGEAGSGKSCMAAKLAHSHDSLIGIHFCKYFDLARCDIRLILLSLAYNISTQLDEYSAYISENVDFNQIETRSISEIFETLYLIPLNKIPVPPRKVVIAIDGIDEIDQNLQKEFFTVLTKSFHKLPPWFGMIITARPESHLSNVLNIFKPYKIEAGSENNKQDLLQYVTKRLSDHNLNPDPIVVKSIVEKSEGNFLYLKHFITELVRNDALASAVNSYPTGMAGVFTEYFDRTFPNQEDYKKRFRPFLEVVTALKCPLDEESLGAILNADEYEIEEIVGCFGTMLQKRDSRISFFHKSLKDWLADKENSKNYFVILKQGEKRICEWIRAGFKDFSENSYMLNFGFLHLAHLGDQECISRILDQGSKKSAMAFASFVSSEANSENTSRLEEIISFQTENSMNLLLVAGTCLSVLVDRGQYSFAKKLARLVFLNRDLCWIPMFTDLLVLRVKGNSNALIELGQELLSNQISDKDTLSQIYYLMGDGYRERGKHSKATEYYRKVLEVLKDEESSSCYVQCLCDLTDLEYVYGNLGEAKKVLENLRTKYRPTDLVLENFKLYRVSGLVSHALKDQEAARVHHLNSLELAKKLMMPHNIAKACNSLAETYERLTEESESYLLRARKIAESIQAGLELGKGYYIEAEQLFNSDCYDQALERGLSALKILTEVGYGSGIARCHSILGKCFSAQGDFTRALEHHLQSNQYYAEQEVYPNLRFESYLEILKCAKAIQKIEFYKNIDNMNRITNLENYPYLDEKLKEARKIIDSNPDLNRV